uniref:tRNA (Guanosine(46)-N7)-methyltransferase TrmB n=2 Tax=Bursaphelenchus xylophilus TaxID=6326 RepID=A0A1I7SJN1_BURXY
RENKSLSLQEWLKVAEFCKRTKHAFRLDGNELVLTDREAPENEFRLPIDRVMSQLA